MGNTGRMGGRGMMGEMGGMGMGMGMGMGTNAQSAEMKKQLRLLTRTDFLLPSSGSP